MGDKKITKGGGCREDNRLRDAGKITEDEGCGESNRIRDTVKIIG